MKRNLLYALAIYVFAFLVGMNIFVIGLSMGLASGEFFLYTMPTFVPAVFFLLYFFRANISNLEQHESALTFLIYVSVAAATFINVVFFVPALLS